MKKFLAIFLLLFMIVSVSNAVFADDPAVIFDIASNGEQVVTVPSGTEVPVTFTIRNTQDASFKVRSINNDIYYDPDFFDLVEGSISVKVNGLFGRLKEFSGGQRFVTFNGSHVPNFATYQKDTVVGTFSLRVKATSGSSTISSSAHYVTYGNDKYYGIDPKNLTVIVGQAPETLYDVVYMNNGQEYASSKEAGEISVLPAPTPAPSGYEFEGWEYGGRLYQPRETFEVTEDVTFVAKWKEIIQIVNYTLTFNTNGGSSIDSLTKAEGTVIDLSSYNPTKSGFEFVGWCSDSDLANEVEEITLTANTTVYAKWEEVIPDYTLTFNTNGGSTLSAVTKPKGTVINLDSYKPTRDGFTFEGWYTDLALSNKVESITLNANTTVYANWEEIIPDYTLTFNTNGGSAVSAVTKPKGTVIDLSAYVTSKTGHSFEGWYSDSDLANEVEEITLTANTTVYAKWKENAPDEYTLTFHSNGGSAISALTKPKGTVIDLSDYIPTRSGYSFEGWYTTSSFNVKVETVKLESDTTVYAKWKKNDGGGGGGGGGGDEEYFTITYRTADGKELDKVKYEYNSTVDLTKVTFEKEGFVFEGWYTDAALTDKVTSIKVIKNTVLYAKFTEKPEEDDKDDEKQDTNYHPAMLTTEHYAYIVGREGGLICPKDNITRAEVATIFFRLLTEQVRNENLVRTNAFDDVNEKDWFNTAVSTLAKLGIINGRTVDTFAPNANITRAEFTTMAARFSDVVYEGEDLFKDIAGHWACGYINAAASIGWVIGDNGLFRPDDNITRAEVMTLVNRMLNREPESVDDLLENMTRWEDNADANAWYYLAVQEATNSHKYELKADGKHEKWTALTENPDWTALEK